MNYDRKTRAWFRREMTGKSVLAQWIDLLLGAAFALFACYVWFLERLQSQSLAIFLAIVAGSLLILAMLLARSMRLDKFINRYSAELHQRALLEHLLLLRPEELRGIVEDNHALSDSHQIGKDLFINRTCLYGIIQRHPNEPYSASALLRFYQISVAHRCNELKIYSTAAPSDDARTLAQQFDLQVVLHEPEELIAIAGTANVLPKEETVQRIILESIDLRRRKQKQARRGLLIPANAKRYLYCGGIIVLSTFVTGYRIYYPMIAALCVCLALISWYLGKYPPRKETVKKAETTPSSQP